MFSWMSGEPSARPVPEVELRFDGDDQDPLPALVGDDPAGKALPTGSFSRLEGGLGSFADYRGKPLVVNFFASWCAPCVAEMPEFEAVHRDLGDRVGFLGVNLQDQVSAGAELVERTGVTYDIARDPKGELAESLGVVGMPSTFLVSSDGRIVKTLNGVVSAGDLRREIEEMSG